jgi:Zn-dependent protease with chaperone function
VTGGVALSCSTEGSATVAAEFEEVGGSARVRFPRISPRAYEHPADRGTLAALRAVPGFDAVLKAVSSAFAERSERLLALASSIRVSATQYPTLDRLRTECASILDVDPVPELFVERDPMPNAYAIGLREPFIVLTTGLVEHADTAGLRFVIGHEMGHVLSGHALYETLLMRLLQLEQGLSWLPAGYWGLRAIVAAMYEWSRKAELSCDRAGLLCGQDPMAALRIDMMAAGAVNPADVDTSAFLQQAADYEAGGDVRDSVIKLLNTERRSHPMSVVRAAELQRWAASAEYRAILTGDYPRRDGQPDDSFAEDIKAAARSYKETLKTSTDPLAKVLNEVGQTLSGAAGAVWQRFGGAQEPGEH